ncbi:integrase arm-type DNA-binding domain-containing protein [Methylocystis sp. H62]|uniref:tyrosine-type recombinase/integrase n=1 Tax=Methylocystis sp. H62 TaxID=2785789 RepID=UPI0018C2F640|nr:integrase arm-type DNA-binding domain-containing protein [Methylocystis sp. H62]MBG0795059.1 integrase arm-type DNA-binding domain-containing protein [Methylocystis sp. H62]
MTRRLHKLTTRKVETAKPGRYGDGGGLYLVVSPSGAKKWVFRFSWRGRPTHAGLGPVIAVSLARAREKAADARAMVADGVNPIESKREGRRLAAKTKTFGEVADDVIKTKAARWRNAKHQAQWRTTLATYAAPLRSKPVDQIDTAAVLAVLTPIWNEKPETASRVRGRIEAVLDFAGAHGMRSGDNPARWHGPLSIMLGEQRRSRGHFDAMPYSDVPAFMERLRKTDSVTALALEFIVLTAARAGEALGATWSEVDFDAKVWIVPAGRMKAEREHRTPLSDRALAILQKLHTARTNEFVFPGRDRGKHASPSAVGALLRRMEAGEATVHGFRSSFRDWTGDVTHFSREVAEAALAHAVGDKAEQAYRRSDALEKRRALMAAWASYIEQDKGGNVVPLQRSGGGTV